jgi:Domain of unknown function (DUF929)
VVRRRRYLLAGVAVGVVVVLVAVVVAVGLTSSSSAKAAPRVPLTPGQQNALTSVPVSTLVAASDTKAASSLYPAYHIPSGSPYTANGKPAILYIGAEFCPICATERWPMVVALSQFGTFSNLSQTRSAVRDGNIATLSFYGSSYTSKYLDFTPVEAQTNVPHGNTYTTLQQPTPAQASLWTNTLGNESYPFVYIGGKYVLDTYQYSSSLIEGKSFDQIASQVGNNSTPVGAAIDASAAALVKYICGITGDNPAATCQAVAGVKAPVTNVTSGGASSSSNG